MTNSEAKPVPDLSNPLGIVFGMMDREAQEAIERSSGAVDMFGPNGWEEYDSGIDIRSVAIRIRPEPRSYTLAGSGMPKGDYIGPDGAIVTVV